MGLFITVVFFVQLVFLVVFMLTRISDVKVVCMQTSLVCLIACVLASIIETIFAILHNGDILLSIIDALLFALLCIFEIDYLKQCRNKKNK